MDVLFGLVAAILFGVLTALVPLALRHHPDPVTGGAVSAVIGFLLCVVFSAVAVAVDPEPALSGLWRFALAGLIAPGVSQILFVRAVRDAGPSRTGILIGTAPVIAAFIAILVLDEPLRAGLAVATALIVVGAIALAREGSRPVGFKLSGILLAALTAVMFAVQANVIRWASTESTVSALLGAAAIMGSGSFLLAAFLLVTLRRSALARARSAVGPFLAVGLVFGLSYATYALAYEHGRVIVVSPLTATESLWTVLGALLLVGRKVDSIGPRVVLASMLVVAGSVLVGVSS